MFSNYNNKIIILYLTTIILLFNLNINKCFGTDSSSSSSNDQDDNSFCIARTAQECYSENACCVWCEQLLPNATSTPTVTPTPSPTPTNNLTAYGYCHHIKDLTECPSDMQFSVCKNYNNTQCTCNFSHNNSKSIFYQINNIVYLILILFLSIILLSFF